MEATMEMENLGKRSGITEVSISNRIKETEDRLSGVEDTIEDIDTTEKTPNAKHPRNSGHNEKTKSQNVWNREQRFTVKGLENVINKIKEENFPT